MAPNDKKRPVGRQRKLKKSDPDFYAKIGRKGGLANADNHGDGYFARLAKLSHKSRRIKARAKAAPLPPESTSTE